MGSSSSSVTQTSNTLMLNSSNITLFNKQVNKSISNTVIKNAQSSAASVSQDSKLDITGGIRASGKGSVVDIEGGALEKAKITLQSLQQSIQSTDIASSMATAMNTQLQNSFTNTALQQMLANANSKMKAGFGSGWANPLSNSSSSVNMSVTNTDINIVKQNISNVI